MTLCISTDHHLLVTRNDGTTPASRKRLQLAMETAARHIFVRASELVPNPVHVSGGDMFDKYTNDEVGLARTMSIIAGFSYLLEGNHDVQNVKDSCSSLKFLTDILAQIPLLPGQDSVTRLATQFGECGVENFTHEDIVMYAIPHVANQDLFEKALDQAEAEAGSRCLMQNQKLVLLLHCNYDSPFTNETSLNLTTERARDLLQKFAYVLIGHDHTPKQEFGGRLVVMGNTHPTCFGDISDKFFYWFENGELKKEQIYSAAEKYIELPWTQIGTAIENGHLSGFDFIRIVGKAMPADLLEISKGMKNLWLTYPNLLAMKQSVELVTLSANVQGGKVNIEKLQVHIERELDAKNPELANLFRELALATEQGA